MRCLSVIVHHRGEEILARCIESLLAENSPNDRIVIFGNGLEEPLPAICKNESIYLAESPQGLGFAEANNLAVQQAHDAFGIFDFYLFINNDATLTPGTLDRLCRHLDQHPECGIVGPRLVIDGSPDHLNSLGLNVTRQGEAWDEGIGVRAQDYGPIPQSSEVLAVTGAALMIRKDVFDALGGWSKLYGYYFEDIDLCIRAWRGGLSVRIEPEALATHAISASTAPVSKFKTLHSWRNQLVLLLLHWPLLLLMRVLPRYLAQQARLYFKRRTVGGVEEAVLQRSALLGALRLLPSIALRRYRGGLKSSWTRFLKPSGSVPVISLPTISSATAPADPPGTGSLSAEVAQ